MPSLVLRQQAANGQLSNETNQKPPTGSKAGTANNKQESKEQKEKEQQRKVKDSLYSILKVIVPT